MPGYRYTDIVVLGDFNPAIFQPDWFAHHDLLPEGEVSSAVDPHPLSAQEPQMLVANFVTSIRFRSIRLEVRRNRFCLSTERLDWEGDLGRIVGSIFKILVHTPVGAFGMNTIEHLPPAQGRTPSEVVAHWVPLQALQEMVGNVTGPAASLKADWDSYKSLLMLERSYQHDDCVFVHQNFEKRVERGATELIASLEEDWERLLDRAHSLRDRILGLDDAAAATN